MDFQTTLEKATSLHGHKCVGLVLGTRIAMAGLKSLEIAEPMQTRDLIVYVELDRCLADAIQAITGCTIGKRTLKHVDYGKFAATFVDLSKNRAVRISVKEEARKIVKKGSEGRKSDGIRKGDSKKQERDMMAEAYSKMPDADLLSIADVKVRVPILDLPGLPKRKVLCNLCGETIFDGREKVSDGQILCRSCADGAYFKYYGRKRVGSSVYARKNRR